LLACCFVSYKQSHTHIHTLTNSHTHMYALYIFSFLFFYYLLYYALIKREGLDEIEDYWEQRRMEKEKEMLRLAKLREQINNKPNNELRNAVLAGGGVWGLSKLISKETGFFFGYFYITWRYLGGGFFTFFLTIPIVIIAFIYRKTIGRF